ncbi:hypothetical protein [Actinomadura opuntiae]|uniref:hypothetical protein n=1 Tax=Actinomadura sp. OS1-43 TaxID=604315 RepID=UPI00255AAFC0|nr:hypothetical protein [Actinomadura sp. OS1-43]MDL4815047.1 hypothetical protein [Actinomadura sp. OS1-43]
MARFGDLEAAIMNRMWSYARREALATSNNQAAALVHFLSDLSPEEREALRTALKVVRPQDTD